MKTLIAAWMLVTSAGDVSNERIPVSGAELEQHWQLDCRGMLDDYNRQVVSETAPENREITIDELRDLASVARKCSFIYNQKGTGREIACPDYQKVSDILQGLVSQGTAMKGDAARPSGLKVESCQE